MFLLDLITERGIINIIDNYKEELEILLLCQDIISYMNKLYGDIIVNIYECGNYYSHKTAITMMRKIKIHDKKLLLSILYDFVKKHNKNGFKKINSMMVIDIQEYIEDVNYTMDIYTLEYFYRELNFDLEIKKFTNPQLLIDYFKRDCDDE